MGFKHIQDTPHTQGMVRNLEYKARVCIECAVHAQLDSAPDSLVEMWRETGGEDPLSDKVTMLQLYWTPGKSW